MSDLFKKRTDEKRMVEYMIRYYCRKHHKGKTCLDCEELIHYAHMRIDKCPFMESKTFCSACKVHCYQKEQREQIRKVMRYSGPRMLWHHPYMAVKHVYIEHKERKL